MPRAIKDHIVVCGWNTTARDLIDELQGRRLHSEGRRHRGPRQEPGRCRRLLRARRRDQRRGPRAGRDRGGVGGPGLPGRRVRRRRHALDPDDHGDRAHRAPRADRGRGQQPASRAALPAGRRRRAPGHLEGRLAPARAVGALSGPDRSRDRHRVGRRGLRAVPDQPARRVHRPVDRQGRLAPAGRAPGDAAVGEPWRPRVRQPGADFVLQIDDDAIVVAESLGTLAPLEMADINAPSRSASVVPSA